jgi:BASS family bile acid:Na+ symporter
MEDNEEDNLAMALQLKDACTVPTLIGIAVVTLASCWAQFAIGRRIGAPANDAIAAGQAIGPKNTVFAIWMAYTFLTPITAIAGGFYSVWHNIFNSYQLYQKRKGQ